jgi:cytochrome c biogenesis protein CcdA
MKKEEETEQLIKEYEEKRTVKTASLTIVLVVFAVFIVILYFTDVIGSHFGKYAENVSLAIIGVILTLMLFKNKSK